MFIKDSSNFPPFSIHHSRIFGDALDYPDLCLADRLRDLAIPEADTPR